MIYVRRASEASSFVRFIGFTFLRSRLLEGSLVGSMCGGGKELSKARSIDKQLFSSDSARAWSSSIKEIIRNSNRFFDLVLYLYVNQMSYSE